MTSIAILGDKLGDMQNKAVESIARIQAIQASANDQHMRAVQTMNDAFTVFNLAMEDHIAALKELIGE